MNYHKTIPWLDTLAFISLALGLMALAFFWMPPVGVCLSAAGLLLGFFGWLTASQNGDASAYYLMVGAIVSTLTLVLNLGLVTHALRQLF